jgi:hypothetical protein
MPPHCDLLDGPVVKATILVLSYLSLMGGLDR